MHIMIATPAFLPYIGGGERHVGSLARYLINRGHSVTVLTSTAASESDFWLGRGRVVEIDSSENGLTVIRMPVRPMPGGFRGLLAWRKAMVLVSALPGTLSVLQSMAARVPALFNVAEAAAAIKVPVDVVHGFNISWEHTMMIAQQYAVQNNHPFIASPLAHLGSQPKDRVALNSTMRHQRFLLASADMLITNTALEARGLKERGVRMPEYRVAGPGVDIPESVTSLSELGISAKPYVLFVGRASFDKGAVHAAQAVLMLRERVRSLQLVMIGPETTEFQRFYDGLSEDEQACIQVLGVVEEGVKHAYLKDAEALLLPSRSDSFGIVLLESWLYGRPVIAAAAGGIPGVVDDGKNGILVQFGDVDSLSRAVELLVRDHEKSQVMGQLGQQKLREQFTWEKVSETVLHAYCDVIKAHESGMTAEHVLSLENGKVS